MSNIDENKQFDLKWKEIYTCGIEKVFLFAENKINFKFPQNEYIKLYSYSFFKKREAYNLCISKKATMYQTKCYNKIIQVITEYCQRVKTKIKSSQKHEMLTNFAESWVSFRDIIIRWILKFFLYLTKTYYFSKQNINLDYQLKLIFYEVVYKECENELKVIFFELMKCLRDNILIDPNNLKIFIDFISNICPNQAENLYVPEYEQLILNSIVEYFKEQYTQAKLDNSIDLYIIWGTKIIRNEEERIRLFLPNNTVEKAISIGKNILFYLPHGQILEGNNGLKTLLQLHNKEALKLCYEIYCNDKPSLSLMGQIFKVHLADQFKNLKMKYESSIETDDPKDIVYNTDFVIDFIEFFNIYNNILTDCFQTNHQFNIIFKEVLESAQVNNKFNTSYILPFFLDKHMKRSHNISTVDSLNVINQVLNVFMSVPEKDVFIEIHRNLLSKRLLSEDYNSLENEKLFVSRLKMMCGVTFTSNVEGMLSDYTNSKELNDNYRQWTRDHSNVLEGNLYVEFNITLLTQSCWPSLNLNKINLDERIDELIRNFNKFYNVSFPKRVLSFSFMNSTCEIERKFGGKGYTFTVNTLQAMILLLFNEITANKEINVGTIFNKISLKDEDLKVSLIPLIQSRLLIRAPDDNSVIRETDLIRVNLNFHSNNRRLKLVTLGKNDEIVKKEKIEDDRSHAIEATIVRVMKGSQKLHHNDLINKVLTQLENFKIQITSIKKKIDNLIEREIIARDTKDKDYYIYTYS